MVGRMFIFRRSSSGLCPSIRDVTSVTGRREFKADPLAIAEIFYRLSRGDHNFLICCE